MKGLLHEALSDSTQKVAESLRSCGIPISSCEVFDSGDGHADPDIELRQDLMPPKDYGQLDVTVLELIGDVTGGGYPPAVGIRWDTPFACVFLYRAIVGTSAESIDEAVKGHGHRVQGQVFLHCNSGRDWGAGENRHPCSLPC